jgi:hypothetical protein
LQLADFLWSKINDHGYTHALRLLKDRESGCIRLAAAKADGEQDVTVWTAFSEFSLYSSNEPVLTTTSHEPDLISHLVALQPLADCLCPKHSTVFVLVLLRDQPLA